MVLADIKDNSLSIIADHRNLATLHENTKKSPPVITKSYITKNIDLIWEIVNEHLEATRGTKSVPVLWCARDAVFPKDHLVDPALYYIHIDEELVVGCPMILACYAVPRDKAKSNDIHVHVRTAM